MKTLASNTTTAANIRSKTIASGNGYSAKSSSQDVIVTLGGLKWEVVYLSNNTDGEPTLTLWLSSSTQDAFKSRSRTEGEYYGYYEGGLYSDWSADWYSTTVGNYPSNMYGTSYIRAVTLNNGGQYATSNSALGGNIGKSTSSVFAPFTVDSYGMTEYIVKPTKMSWQRDQSSIKQFNWEYTLPNEAIAPSSTNWNNSTYNYSTKTNYTAWENDNLWLPSLAETGSSDSKLGMWGLSVNQRKNYDGSTQSISLSSVVGSSNKNDNTYLYTNSWLRSGYFLNTSGAYYLATFGSDYNDYTVDGTYAVRPALHLNLKQIQDSFIDTWEKYAAENYAGGIGTETNPYIIKTAEQLAKLAKDSRTSGLAGIYYKLGANIDLKGHTLDGLGDAATPFAGVFDGDYYSISGFITNYTGTKGFFKLNVGTIKNLVITQSSFRNNNSADSGLLVGTNHGLIENCIVENCEIIVNTGGSAVGGLVGGNAGTIKNSSIRNSMIYNIGTLRVAGLVGSQNSNGKMINCSATGMRIFTDNYYNNLCYSESGERTACFAEADIVKPNKFLSVKEIYDNSNDWTGWTFISSINKDYPIQKSLLHIGGIVPTVDIYTYLTETLKFTKNAV